MLVLRSSPNGLVFRSWADKDNLASLSVELTATLVTGGAFVEVQDADAVFREYQTAEYFWDGRLETQGMVSPTFRTLSPAVATLASDGTIIRRSSGILHALVSEGPTTLQATVDLRNKTDADGQPSVFLSVVPGSLSHHVDNQVKSRIASGMSLEVNGGVFSVQDHDNAVYTRNPNLWCADLDMTCLSPWNSLSGPYRAGTAITPRHVLGAKHYPLPIGAVLRFVGPAGQVYDRTIITRRALPVQSVYYPDFMLYVLSEDLPPEIKPCQLLPSNIGDLMVHTRDIKPLGIGLNQFEQALVMRHATPGVYGLPVQPEEQALSSTLIPGDSGNPAFLVINDELVLDTVWTGVGYGTAVSDFTDGIAQMILDADRAVGLPSVHQIAHPDLSEFPSYA